jgi:hypothetical protein
MLSEASTASTMQALHRVELVQREQVVGQL